MHEVELMMAVIVASTALAGLAGVVMGQIKEGRRGTRFVKCCRVSIILSFLLSILAVLFAINWFDTENSFSFNTATWCFGIQLIVFSIVASAFWLEDK